MTFTISLAACVPDDAPDAAAPSDDPPSAVVASALFIENVGQFPPEVRFMVRGGPGGSPQAWVTDRGLWLTARERAPIAAAPGAAPDAISDAEPGRAVALAVRFDGAARAPRIEPFGRVTTTHLSYFVGEPDAWRSDVPLWTGVRYAELYPGVDLVLEADAGRWTPRIEARTPAARAQVQLRVDGADRTTIGDHAISIDTQIGAAVLPFEGLTAAAPALSNQSGELAEATVSQGLLGPVLAFSTYWGGAGAESGRAIALGPNFDRLAITGFTSSNPFPTTAGVFDITANGSNDVFVTGMTAGGAILFSTYLGGISSDVGLGLAMDGGLSVYVTGQTVSPNFPVTPGAFDTVFSGGVDAFVSKLNFNGTVLVYSTYLGGAGSSVGRAIAVLGNEAYVTGQTSSAGFPIAGIPFDPVFNGGVDAFVTRLNGGGFPIASTFLGSASTDIGNAIAVTSTGVFVTGQTGGAAFPVTAGSFGPVFNGSVDAFVVKLDPLLGTELWGGFLGTPGGEVGNGIALDTAGNVHVVGTTNGPGLPVTATAPDPTFNGGTDTFVARIAPVGNPVLFCTYLGTPGRDIGNGIAVRNGDDYLVGLTDDPTFPIAGATFDGTFNGGLDAFVTRITAGGPINYSTYLGGAGNETGWAIAVAGVPDVYITGDTTSNPFPTVAAVDPTYNGGQDVFVTRF